MFGLLLFLGLLTPSSTKQMDTLHDPGILHIDKRLNFAGPGCRKKSGGPEVCGCGACYVCDFATCTCIWIQGCTVTLVPTPPKQEAVTEDVDSIPRQ